MSDVDREESNRGVERRKRCSKDRHRDRVEDVARSRTEDVESRPVREKTAAGDGERELSDQYVACSVSIEQGSVSTATGVDDDGVRLGRVITNVEIESGEFILKDLDRLGDGVEGAGNDDVDGNDATVARSRPSIGYQELEAGDIIDC